MPCGLLGWPPERLAFRPWGPQTRAHRREDKPAPERATGFELASHPGRRAKANGAALPSSAPASTRPWCWPLTCTAGRRGKGEAPLTYRTSWPCARSSWTTAATRTKPSPPCSTTPPRTRAARPRWTSSKLVSAPGWRASSPPARTPSSGPNPQPWSANAPTWTAMGLPVRCSSFRPPTRSTTCAALSTITTRSALDFGAASAVAVRAALVLLLTVRHLRSAPRWAHGQGPHGNGGQVGHCRRARR